MTFPLRQAAVLAYLFLVLLFGGASAAGHGANTALQFGGAALIAWTLWKEAPSKGISTGLRPFLLGVAIVFAVQFLPMPPAFWRLIPGRETIAAGFDLAGIAHPWLPLSLDPWGSLQSLVWWIPALALLTASRASQAPSARHMIWVIAAVAYASVVLAAVQTFSGSGYFYTITNYNNGVGFFANSNHLGTFLLCAMALLAGQWLHDRPLGRHAASAIPDAYLLAGLLAPLVVGVVLTNSLACMLLMVPLLLGILLIARPEIRINWFLAGAIGIVASVGLVWLLASGLVANDLMSKSGSAGISRGEFLANGLKILGAFAPLGSGIGTFREIYPWYENPALVGTTYVNHAHNDLLELLIETGLFGLVLIGLFLRWFVAGAWRCWNHARSENPVALAATLAIIAALAHSLVDYPLRTAAVSSVFALCCVLIRRPADPRGAALVNAGPGAGKRDVLMEI